MSESAITRADLAQELWGHDAGTQAHCREVTDRLITAIAECLRFKPSKALAHRGDGV